MILSLEHKKQKLDSYRPFPTRIIENLDSWFSIELTYTSNAIEGNTLTRAETSLVVEKGLTVGGKPLKDHIEATNHQKALTHIKSLVNQSSITTRDILAIHALILQGIDDTAAGVYRDIAVRISGSTVIFPNPSKVPQLMDDLEGWMIESKEHPVDKAIDAHYKFVTIHPFIDGNGRTARLLMNLLLMQAGYPPIIVSPKDRLKYIKALEKAQLGEGYEDYTALMYKLLDKSLNLYMKAITQQAPEASLSQSKLLKIGELSKRADLPISTLRHWIKIGLIEVAQTTSSGYQLFDENVIRQINKIIEYKRQRLSLEETLEKLNNE